MAKRNSIEWSEELADLPAGLSLAAISCRFKDCAKSTVLRQLKRRGIKYEDERRTRQRIDPKWLSADFSKTNSELSSLMGVSVQRVAVMRARVVGKSTDRPTNQPTIDSTDLSADKPSVS